MGLVLSIAPDQPQRLFASNRSGKAFYRFGCPQKFDRTSMLIWKDHFSVNIVVWLALQCENFEIDRG